MKSSDCGLQLYPGGRCNIECERGYIPTSQPKCSKKDIIHTISITFVYRPFKIMVQLPKKVLFFRVLRKIFFSNQIFKVNIYLYPKAERLVETLVL